MKPRKTREVTEFGDFQTPLALAMAAAHLLAKSGTKPHTILEPTCGRGAFVAAAAEIFPKTTAILGFDINEEYLAAARRQLQNDKRVTLHHSDFFSTDWSSVINEAEGPWLILGNPPWVTSAEQGAIAGKNLPGKSNFHGRLGIEAITGKSNFDISEWMLLRYLEWLQGKSGMFAVLCKTAVARKVLLHAWKHAYPVKSAKIYGIDALSAFSAAVDACFFVVEMAAGDCTTSCDIFDSLEAKTPARRIDYQSGHIIHDVTEFSRHIDLLGRDPSYVWRSGIKHDCAKIMELRPDGAFLTNGLGERIELEDRYLYPLLKSSDIGNGRVQSRLVMLVPQKSIGEDTQEIRNVAPKTWRYLCRHADRFEARASSIYRNKPVFSIFGVGAYSFTPWKIAISGFYKDLKFVRIGPLNGKPAVFDDTVYFLPCESEEEANFLHGLLSSQEAMKFLRSMISWDEKRPITVDLLKRLNLLKLAERMHRKTDYLRFVSRVEGSLFEQSKNAA
jgi:hypothetical protein